MKIWILLIYLCTWLYAGDAPAPSPIGDNVHSDVYFFIKDALLREKSIPAAALKKRHADEAHLPAGDKPHMATIAETELSHILDLLRKAHPNCTHITLYQQNGVAIATAGTSPVKEPLAFLDHDPKLGIIENKEHTETLSGIYYDRRRDVAYLGVKKERPTHRLIGYAYFVRTKAP